MLSSGAIQIRRISHCTASGHRKRAVVVARSATIRDGNGDVDHWVVPPRLNTYPCARESRQRFYEDLTQAAMAAVSAGERRIALRLTYPETNPEMDVFRIGSVLECIRELALSLASDGQLVKICVQQSLGEGVFSGTPLSLAGVSRIMRTMEWGDVADFIRFGEVRAEEVDECQHYLLITPQNHVNGALVPELESMADKAEAEGKTILLFNPLLQDVPSGNGMMSIRGRKERQDFVASFTPAYHFRLLYASAALYPIMGALRYSYGGPWTIYRRKNLGKKAGAGPVRGEVYEVVGETNRQPGPEEITKAFSQGGGW